MRGADADFVLGADHAERLYAAELRFLDGEALLLPCGVEGCADGGHDYGLAGGYVGGAADNLQRSLGPGVDLADVHVVAVGMRFAGEHLADNHAAESSADRLDFLERVTFKAQRGQGLSQFGR